MTQAAVAALFRHAAVEVFQQDEHSEQAGEVFDACALIADRIDGDPALARAAWEGMREVLLTVVESNRPPVDGAPPLWLVKT